MDTEPWLEVDLTRCASASFMVSAVRILWKEVYLDYTSGRKLGPIGYLLQGQVAIDRW